MDLLEELRVQRELIRKHLAWLDQKIAKLERHETKGSAPTADEDAPAIGKVPLPESAKVTPATDVAPPPQEEEPEEQFGSYEAPKGNDVLRAKIGCLVLFILSIVLFLFLLFGLPYLVDFIGE